MKNLKITVCMAVLAITGMIAQKGNSNTFLLSPEVVKIYDFEASTEGVHYEYEFEDDYTAKLTNKVYKISLFFDKDLIEAVQNKVSYILDGNNTFSGLKTMFWKKTTQNGKPKYIVEIKNKKLRIEIIRKNSDAETYETLTQLGQEFLKTING